MALGARDRHREKQTEITHLLYAPEFDRQYSAATRRRALALTREAASAVGLPLIPIVHNGAICWTVSSTGNFLMAVCWRE